MSDKVIDIVTQRAIDAMENGIAPWRRPWSNGVAPCNLVRKRPYRGWNAIVLGFLSPYASPYWLTLKEVKSKGGRVKNGEFKNGWPVVFYKFPDAAKVKEAKEAGKRAPAPITRFYTVYNVEQTEGIAIPTITGRTHTADEEAERIIANMPNRPKIQHGGNCAGYTPALDLVMMPNASQFVSGNAYYKTLFHELTHATGHEKRLDRGLDGTFGTDPYAREELVAEFGAAILSAECGAMDTDEETQTAAYLAGWLTRLKKDKRLLVTAAGQAQKAVDYIMNRTPEKYEPEAE